jgi:Cu-Zn family superoxide dismutase
MKAIVLFHPIKKSLYSMSEIPLQGFILFKQLDINSPVKITVFLKGLPDGAHGFHIHEKGMNDIKKCDNVRDCCKQLGGHFNVEPTWSLDNLDGVKHGQHNGDLDFNIYSEGGLAQHYFQSDKISLFSDQKENVLDRTLVIHEDQDDMGLAHYEEDEKNIESYITGNAGARIACGEIKKILEN